MLCISYYYFGDKKKKEMRKKARGKKGKELDEFSGYVHGATSW